MCEVASLASAAHECRYWKQGFDLQENRQAELQDAWASPLMMPGWPRWPVAFKTQLDRPGALIAVILPAPDSPRFLDASAS